MAINWDDIPVYDPTKETENGDELVEFAPEGFNNGGLSIRPRDLEDPTVLGEVKKGLVRGGYELGAMGAGLVGLAGDAVGADSVADWGVEKYKELEGKAAENAANVQNFDDIHGLGDAGLYAAGVLGEQLPILVPAIASGGAGGLAARALGRRVIADQVAKKVAEGVAQDVAEKEVADLVASEIYKKAAQTSIERGAQAGAFAGNYGMIAGGSFGQIAEETGEKDAGVAAAFAVPGAALETLFDVYLGKKLLGPLMGAEGTRAPGVSGFLGNAAKVAGEGAAIEAPTEYLQTGLEQASVGAADPNRTIGDVVMSPEAELDRERAAVAGVTAGFGFGAGAGVVNSAFTPSLTPQTDQALQNISFSQKTAPDGGTVVDPEAFHEPVSIMDGEREHTLVQAKGNGQWFLTNPGEEFDNIPKTGPTGSWVAINPDILSRRDTIGAALVERATAALNDKNEGVNREGDSEETDTESELDDESNLEAYDPAARTVDIDALRSRLNEWDRTHRRTAENDWFEAARVNEQSRNGFTQALQGGGDQIQAHGMAKAGTLIGSFNDLITHLTVGLDPNRRGGQLDTAPLVSRPGEGLVGATASGSAYSDGPLMILQRPGTDGLTGKLENAGAILVNEAHPEFVPGIREAIQSIRPDIIVDSYSNAGSVVAKLNSSPSGAVSNTDKNLRQSPLGAELLRNDLKGQQPRMGRAELSARTIVAKSDPAEGDRLAAINEARNVELEAENQRIASLGALNPGTRITYQLPGGEARTGDLYVSGYDEQGNLLANTVDVSRVDELRNQISGDTQIKKLRANIAKLAGELAEAESDLDDKEAYVEGLRSAGGGASVVATAEKSVAAARERYEAASQKQQIATETLEKNPAFVSLQAELKKAEDESQQNRAFTIPKQNFGAVSTMGAPLNPDKNLAQSPLGAELLRQQLAQQEEETRRRTQPKRNPDEAKAFAASLEAGDSVTYWPEDGDAINAKVAGRRANGSLILTTGNRIKGTLKVVDVPKNNFSRIGLQQPKVKLGSINDAISGVLGNNPTTQQIEGAGLRKVAGESGSYETEIGDGLGSDELPIKVSLYRRKGDKETLVVKSKGLFTNDPRTTLRQINRGLAVEVPETLSLIHPDIQVETVGGKKIVTAVSDKTHNGKTKKFGLNNVYDTGAYEGLVVTAGDTNAGVFAFEPFTREVYEKLKQSGRKTVDLVDSKFVTTRTMRQSKTDPADIRFDSPLTMRGSGSKKRGIGVADEVLKNDERFRQKSEAGMIGSRGEGQSAIVSENIESPISKALQGLYGKLNELDAVDNEILRRGLDRIASYFKGANLSPEVADYAFNASRDELVRAMMTFRGYVLDEKKGEYVLKKGFAPVTPFKNQESVQLSSEFLVALDQARENRKAELPEKIKKQLDIIEADEEKQNEAVRKRGGKVSAMTAAEKEKSALYAIERGDDATLRDAVKIAGAGKTAAQKRVLESIKNRYKKGGRVNVLTLAAKNANKAVKRFEGNPMASIQKNIVDAKRMLARRGNLFSKESLDKPAEGSAETPAQVNAGVAQSKVEASLTVSSDRDFFEDKASWQKRAFDTLTPGDNVILQRGSGNLRDGEKPLNQKEKQRYGLLKRYLASGGVGSDGKYPAKFGGTNEGNTLGGRPAGVSASEIPLSEFNGREELSGVMESRAPRVASEGAQGRPDDVGGSDAGAAGAVQGASVQNNGRSGVGTLNAEKTRQLGESARRRFVQSFARLTDEELGKLSLDEINSLTEAITSQFDEAAAKASRNAISGTAVPAEDLVNRGATELVSRYAEGLREQQENAVRIARMRENARRLALAGGFKSQTDFLNTVALGNYPQDMKLRAKAMLTLGARGFAFNDLAVQIGRFQTAEGNDTTWAGIISGDGRDIAINLDSAHDRNDIIQTYLHELGHAVTIAKIDRTIPLNPIEERALGRLEAIRQDAVIRAARRENLSVPANPSTSDIARLSEELYSKSDDKRELGGLRNLKEFAVELNGSPDLAALMADLGFGGENKQPGSLKSMVRAVQNAWNALVSLITDRVIDANSPLARAFTDSWVINFGGEAAGGSGGTVVQITKSPLRETLGRLRDQGSWITAQINERGLAGTAEDRNRLASEYGKAMAARAEGAVPVTAEELPTATDTAEDVVDTADTAPSTALEVDENGELVYSTPTAPVRDAAEQGDLSWMGAESRAPKASQEELDRIIQERNSYADLGREFIQAVAARPEMFSFPRELSTSKTLKEVLDSTGVPFSTLNIYGRTLISARPFNGEMVAFKESYINQFGVKAERLDYGVVRKRGRGKFTVMPPYEKGAFNDNTSADKYISEDSVVLEEHVMLQPENEGRGDNEFSINSTAGPGVENTSEIYQGVYQWAHNSGVKIVEDGAGTGKYGNYRRTSHQISSALRIGSADHFEPTADQLIRMYGTPEEIEEANRLNFGVAELDEDQENLAYRAAWQTSNYEQKVGALAAAEAKYIEREVPSIVSLSYDPSTGTFRDDRGEVVYPDAIGDRLTEIHSGDKAAGRTSSVGRVGKASGRRYLATKALMEGTLGLGLSRGLYQKSLDETLYSKAPKVNWKPLVKTTYTGGTYVAPGKLSVDNKLDPRAGERFRVRGREIAAANNKAEYWARELNSRIKRLYKTGEAPLELMNTALGSIENPLTRAQIQEIEEVKDSAKRSDLRDRYLRENREAFRAKQAAALEALPPEIGEAIGEMNSQITELSQILKDENVIGDSLEGTVDANLGIYLNRSYEIFDNPEWADKVRKNETIMGNTRKYIRDIMVKNKAAKLMSDTTKALPREEALRQAGDMVTPEEVERALEDYLAAFEDGPSIQVLAGRIPGQKNLSILTERGTIAPEIQELWGVRKDPSANYANTFNKMSALIANDRFLKDLKAIGLKEGWLFDPESRKDDPDARIPRGFSRIASESNKSLAPLNGIYAMPELAFALTEMFPADASENQAAWLNLAMKATGLSMASKTVWSATSQVRNGLSNILNLAAAGNLSLGDLASGKAFDRAGFARDLIMADSFGRYKADPKAWRAEIEDMIRRGVLGESVTGNLLDELMDMNRAAEKGTLPETLFQKITAPVKAASGFAQKTYKAGDDLFKVMHYLAEMEKYRKAFPTMGEGDLKNLAAKNARDIHWTYSMAPDVVKDIKKFPFVAPFITFTTEVIRTSINLGKLSHSEIMEGRRTGNKELEKIGWQRARGMAVAALLPGAVASSAMAMAGISGDDEDDLRRFLPDWQKNNQLLMFRKQNGEVSFVDISYLDPYTYLKKPVTALMRSLHNPENAEQIIVDGALGAAKEALSPFLSEQIFAGAIMDVMRNRDSSGRQVYNPQDSAASIGAAVAGKLIYDPFVPGTVTSLGRVYKAATNQTSESGRDYSLGNELASMVAGQRVSAVDAQQALAFKATTFGREMRDASALFGKQFTGRGTRSEGDVISGYAKANAAHMDLINNLRKDYLASIRLGLTTQQATKILKDARVGDDLLRMVKTGVYRRYEASTAASNLAKTRPDKTRIAGYNAALKETPRTQPLTKR